MSRRVIVTERVIYVSVCDCNSDSLVLYSHFPLFLYLLPPATKLGQGYVFTGACDSVHRGVSASVHAGIPPGADTPPADTPQSRHPPRADTPELTHPASPRANTHSPREQTPPTEHAGRYGQRTGGTHPTEVQSCYHPQTKFAKVMFLQASVCPQGGGVCVVAPGGHAWLLWGGMHGCSGGHVWLLWGVGGMHGCWGACMVAPGGACAVALGGCVVAPGGACVVAPGGACVVAPRGACVVAPGGGHAWLLPGGCAWLLPGGHAWLLPGGMRGCSRGAHAW